jgi:hypothetical protein
MRLPLPLERGAQNYLIDCWAKTDYLSAFPLISLSNPLIGNLLLEVLTMGLILVIVLILLLLGAIPSWPHSRNWGYGPSGGIGLILVIIIILLLLHVI